MADVEAKVLKCKDYLLADLDDTKLQYVLKKLSQLNITIDILQSTRIGKIVSTLKKRDGAVADKARDIVRKWKEMVSKEAARLQEEEEARANQNSASEDEQRESSNENAEYESEAEQSANEHSCYEIEGNQSVSESVSNKSNEEEYESAGERHHRSTVHEHSESSRESMKNSDDEEIYSKHKHSHASKKEKFKTSSEHHHKHHQDHSGKGKHESRHGNRERESHRKHVKDHRHSRTEEETYSSDSGQGMAKTSTVAKTQRSPESNHDADDSDSGQEMAKSRNVVKEHRSPESIHDADDSDSGQEMAKTKKAIHEDRGEKHKMHVSVERSQSHYESKKHREIAKSIHHHDSSVEGQSLSYKSGHEKHVSSLEQYKKHNYSGDKTSTSDKYSERVDRHRDKQNKDLKSVDETNRSDRHNSKGDLKIKSDKHSSREELKSKSDKHSSNSELRTEHDGHRLKGETRVEKYEHVSKSDKRSESDKHRSKNDLRNESDKHRSISDPRNESDKHRSNNDLRNKSDKHMSNNDQRIKSEKHSSISDLTGKIDKFSSSDARSERHGSKGEVSKQYDKQRNKSTEINEDHSSDRQHKSDKRISMEKHSSSERQTSSNIKSLSDTRRISSEKQSLIDIRQNSQGKDKINEQEKSKERRSSEKQRLSSNDISLTSKHKLEDRHQSLNKQNSDEKVLSSKHLKHNSLGKVEKSSDKYKKQHQSRLDQLDKDREKLGKKALIDSIAKLGDSDSESSIDMRYKEVSPVNRKSEENKGSYQEKNLEIGKDKDESAKSDKYSEKKSIKDTTIHQLEKHRNKHETYNSKRNEYHGEKMSETKRYDKDNARVGHMRSESELQEKSIKKSYPDISDKSKKDKHRHSVSERRSRSNSFNRSSSRSQSMESQNSMKSEDEHKKRKHKHASRIDVGKTMHKSGTSREAESHKSKHSEKVVSAKDEHKQTASKMHDDKRNTAPKDREWLENDRKKYQALSDCESDSDDGHSRSSVIKSDYHGKAEHKSKHSNEKDIKLKNRSEHSKSESHNNKVEHTSQEREHNSHSGSHGSSASKHKQRHSEGHTLNLKSKSELDSEKVQKSHSDIVNKQKSHTEQNEHKGKERSGEISKSKVKENRSHSFENNKKSCISECTNYSAFNGTKEACSKTGNFKSDSHKDQEKERSKHHKSSKHSKESERSSHNKDIIEKECPVNKHSDVKKDVVQLNRHDADRHDKERHKSQKQKHRDLDKSKDKSSKKRRLEHTEFQDMLSFDNSDAVVSENVRSPVKKVKDGQEKEKEPVSKASKYDQLKAKFKVKKSHESKTLGLGGKIEGVKRKAEETQGGPEKKRQSSEDLASLLPSTQAHYRPYRYGDIPEHNDVDEQDSSAFLMQRNTRTQVYSGKKQATVTEMHSLFDLCIKVLQENIDCIDYVGGIPLSILAPVLEKCTADQLYNLEDYNPHFLEDSDYLWKRHCDREFKGSKPDELETWRELYLRKLDEREHKLKSIRANITKHMAEAVPVKKTKLAYMDNVAKPPREVRRQQARFGTSNMVVKGGDGKKHSLPPAFDMIAIGRAKQQMAERAQKAPMMQKTLHLLKNIKR
ncbi:dentin sialophosphoprotein-like [Dreissena polymorpha]|uniref:TFIIS N-terminal domain-containing protein n=1 Tax=Dreissena polymorpha TaxID=45954 RepID=A0A9D4BX12_DREPO|nr:dentin sialophosphoprotein-like [Dreissena polymorpha]KAH3710043.1 hypothetical protein DPMN_069509 [Dreissena polymorpha]